MKTAAKQVISAILVLCVCITLLPTVAIEADAVTTLSLAELQAKYPSGKYWNHAGNPGSSNSVNNPDGYTSTPCTKHGVIGTSEQTCNGFTGGGNTQLSWQCMGFAEQLGYLATGYNPRNNANGWSTSSDSSALNSLKAGDIVRYKNNGHSIYVTSVDGDTVTYADCNSDGHCIIRWGMTISKSTLKSTFTYVRSAPSALHVTNLPYGVVDSVTPGVQKVTVRGWVFDKDDVSRELAIHVYIGNTLIGTGVAGQYRPDVNNVYGVGDYHGYEFDCAIPVGLTGSQTVTIYAIDNEGAGNPSLGSVTVNISADTTGPVISDVKITNITSTGYTVTCKVTDNTGVNRVQFPTWTAPSQDDLNPNWGDSSACSGTKNGDIYTFQVKFSDHNNEKTRYVTHIYAYDNYGNVSSFGCGEVSAQYTISFNANGGSGAPSSQTKTHGVNLTLSSTKPTRTGYTFQGWATSSSATAAAYQPGASYTGNADATLYAVWKANTYTISYNANGGSGAPSSQTKTYGKTLTLSTTKPTRTNYTFKGWATSNTATSAAYQPGSSYTTNSSATLYAVWEHVCAAGHSYSYKVTTTPTTSVPGVLTGTCSKCSSTTTVNLPKLNTADYTYTVIKAATCTANGTERYTWKTTTYGSIYLDVTISKTGHSFTNYVSNGDATCTTDGTKTAKCDRCDVTDTMTDVESAKGHEHADATCTAPKTCKVCGVTEGDPLDHSYATTWSKGEDGHWHECSACGDKTDFAAHDYGTEGDNCVICEYARAHVHRLMLVPAMDATCTDSGNKAYYTCSGCENWFEDGSGAVVISDKSSVIIGALGHDPSVATCTETAKCRREGCCHIEREALGHSFTNYVSNNDATCTEDGAKTAKCDRCDAIDTISDVGSAKGHDYADATCTAPKTCEVCGATEGEALDHSFTNYASNNDTTCTADGTKTAKCDRCDVTDTITDVGSAKGHDYADATCTAPKTCEVCGATEGDPLGHSFTNYVSNGDATCTADGTKTAKCERCDLIDTITDIGSAKGHSYATTWSKHEDGHWHECSTCGDKTDFAAHDYGSEGDNCVICEYARAHVHRLMLVTATDATCTDSGNKAYYSCSGCENWFEDASGSVMISDKTSVIISAKGHNLSDATCTEAAKCQRDGCGYIEGAALGHSFTNYVPNGNATCIGDGTKTAKCDRCDVTDTITDVGSAKGHDYADATCTTPKTCKVCGTTEGDPLGHSYATTWSKGEDGHWHECAACGDNTDFVAHDYGDGDKCVICEYERAHIHRLTLVPVVDATCTTEGNVAYYTCSGCENWFEDASGSVVISDKTSVVIAALGHNLTDATCTEAPHCKREGCEYTEGSALGHSFTNYVSNGVATCTADGTKTAKCGRCDVTDTVTDVGSAKGHDYADATCTEAPCCKRKGCEYTEGSALGHSFTNYVSNGDGTCTEDGTKTAKCERCEVTDTITDVGSAKGHDYEDAICTALKTCKICGATDGDPLGHNYVTTWSKGEDGHWHECAAYGDKTDFAAHEYEGDKCKVCEYERIHTHSLNAVPTVEATCTTDGNIAYYICSGCENWFEDASGSIVISDKSSVVITALGHDMTDATCTEASYCQHEGCDYTEGSALGHINANADSKCDRCGIGMESGQPTTPDKPTHDVPQTGDSSNTMLWAILMIMSFAGIIICVIFDKKRNVA